MAAVDAHATFKKFPELPPELRLMIWRYAASTRIIELELSNLCSKATPAILRTCYESREEVRRTYQRLKLPRLPRQIIWMNFSIDVLYLQIQPGRTKSLLKLLKTRRLEGLRYLALWVHTWGELCSEGFGPMVVEALPSLYELILVDEDDGLSLTQGLWKWGSEITFVQLSAEEKELITPRPNSEALHKPFVKLCNVQTDSKAPWTRRGYKDREGRVRFVTGTRRGIEAHYVASGESPRGN